VRVVTVAEASDPVEAAIWVDALRDAGIEAQSYERGVGAALGGAMTIGASVYPIVVAAEQLGAARNVVAELGGAGALSPYRDPAEAASRSRSVLFIASAVVAAIVLAGLLARFI
jgi:hypothetical protein